MMKKCWVLLCGLCWSVMAFSLSGQAYLERFNTYWDWYQQLPFQPNEHFIEFIKNNAPLSNKLRDKWLYELARKKEWNHYVTYYQPSNDLNLRCYYHIAQYQLGQYQNALTESVPLWLSGVSQPKACDALFDRLLHAKEFNQELITQRIALALDRHNVQLARYLLKQYKIPKLAEVNTLNRVSQNPSSIPTLKPSELNGYFYLYGLKRLISNNMALAIRYWQLPQTPSLLNKKQQQDFIAHIALYKAMRNDKDALKWFAQIGPAYSNEVVSDWKIRLALKQQHWGKVATIIQQAKNKDTPCWQYWLARALEQQGKKDKALSIYEPLSQNRNYYGFLASVRMKRAPHFENEKPNTNLSVLKPYQAIIQQIQTLYLSHNTLAASRLLSDFMSELPKDEASALMYWVDTELQWHDKSIYLSSDERLNNQLALRFPLAYKAIVTQYAARYAIAPEFVYAIIRQESSFREDVISSAGARGLMQLIPQTARGVSKALRISYTDEKQLFGKQKNINIGVAYLQQLTHRFNHPVLIAAAYNAGPGQVVYWLRTHPPEDIDIWIETLPWQETRNYLKNIMAFFVVYQYRLNQKPNLTQFLSHF
jgi:soluble lytic murein transglycosylase